MATTTYNSATSEVLKALENPKFRWRTIMGVAKDTGLSADQVSQILISLPAEDIVRTPSRKGRLYTTRKHYRDTETFASRLFSVFSDVPK